MAEHEAPAERGCVGGVGELIAERWVEQITVVPATTRLRGDSVVVTTTEPSWAGTDATRRRAVKRARLSMVGWQ